MHKGGAVPRLVSMQGSFVYGPSESHDDSSSAASLAVAEPVYRHPADAQPPMVGWTSAVLRAKQKVEEALGGQQKFNHALVQYYRNGDDYISEHGRFIMLNFLSLNSCFWPIIQPQTDIQATDR